MDDFVTVLRGLLNKPARSATTPLPTMLNQFQQYRYILQIIEYCARYNSEGAKKLCSRFAGEYLTNMESSYYEYNNLSTDSLERSDKTTIISICETFAAEIRSFAGILNTDDEECIRSIFRDSKKGIISQVLGLSSHPHVDPKVLAAACELALALFSTQVVQKDVKVRLRRAGS